MLQVETLRQQSCRQTISQLRPGNVFAPIDRSSDQPKRGSFFRFQCSCLWQREECKHLLVPLCHAELRKLVEQHTISVHKEPLFCQTRVPWHRRRACFFDCERPPDSATWWHSGIIFRGSSPTFCLIGTLFCLGQTAGRSRAVGSKPRKASERRDQTRLCLRMFVHFATCMYCNRLQFTRSFVCRSPEKHDPCVVRAALSPKGVQFSAWETPYSKELRSCNMKPLLEATLTVRG